MLPIHNYCYFKRQSTYMLSIALLGLSGCTWVNINDSGKIVDIVSERHIQHCQKVGSLDVSTKASLLGVQRNAKKILSELETLARNKATSINADTLVAKDKPIKGAQAYNAYRCNKT